MNLNMNDERLGVPSASGMEALFLCPGRHNACSGLPEQESEDANFGNKVHDALAVIAKGGSIQASACDLDFDQDILQAAEELWVRARPIIDWWQEDAGSYGGEIQRVIESRFILRKGVLPIYTGKPDLVLVAGDRALILDWKSLPGRVNESRSNHQLAALAALVADKYGCQRVDAAIVQRMVAGKPQVVTFGVDDLSDAKMLCTQIVAAASKPDAPRVPGPVQCKYCKFADQCPEARAAAMQVATIGPRSIAALPAQDIAPLWDQVAQAEGILSKMRDAMKERVLAGEDIPGLATKPGAVRKTITDVGALYERASGRGVSQGAFVRACSVQQKALTDLLRSELGVKGRELDDLRDELLSGIVEEKESAASVVRKEAA